MSWIKKHLGVLGLSVSLVALLMSAISLFSSHNTEERVRKIELYDRVKEVSKKLNLRFNGEGLAYDSRRAQPEETPRQRENRLLEASVEILTIEQIVNSEEKSLVVFLKSALLFQQGAYEKLDSLYKENPGSYDQITFLASVAYEEYKSGRLKNPQEVLNRILKHDPKNNWANLISALIYQENGQYKLAKESLKNIDNEMKKDPNIVALNKEIDQQISGLK